MVKTDEELRAACQHYEECHNALKNSEARVVQTEREFDAARRALTNREKRLALVTGWRRRDSVALDAAREALA